MSKFAFLRRGGSYLLPLSILVLAVAMRIAAPGLLDRGALIAFDLYQRAAPRETGNLPIRIVDIDEASLKELGQWPWPRGIIAKLIDRLREAGASVVGFDIAFAEPDRTSPRMLVPLLAQNGLSAEEMGRLLASVPDPDDKLAATMRTLPVVTGFILDDRGSDRAPAAKAGFAFIGDDPLSRVPRFSGAIPNLPEFEAAAAGNGFLNQHLDWDNVVRRVPLVLKLGDKPYPSLAAEMLRIAAEAHGFIGRGAGAQAETSFGANTGMTELRIGPLIVPTDEAGRVAVHFAPPPSNLYVSAGDILAGTFDRSLIDQNIVLVGTSATGLINDRQATPIAPNVPGVEVHAQLIEQVLNGDYLVRPDWAIGAEILFALLVGGGLIWLLPRIGALPSAAVGLSAVTAAVAASWFAFQRAASDRPGLPDRGPDAGLSRGNAARLSAYRSAPARNPQGLFALHVAALRRGAGAQSRKAGARRRDAGHDDHVLRHPGLHHLVGGHGRPDADAFHQRIPVADDRNHHGA